MKKAFFNRGLLIGITILGLSSAVPAVTQALPAHAEEAQTSAEERQATARTDVEELKATAQTRLADAKLKMCQSREKVITNIMTRLGDRGQKQVDLFSTIAERIKTFYADKGKTLTNYDTLTADVTAKKVFAQTTVDTVKSTAPEFKCDGTDPKGIAATFKDNLKSEIEALNAYKTSVKNLIVGVRSIQGTTSSAENGGTD